MKAIGFGFGLALAGALIYGFFISEAMRLLIVGLGAFLLAVVVIGGTALMVNKQWMRTLEGQKTTYNNRYQLPPPQFPAQLPPGKTETDPWAAFPATETTETPAGDFEA